jgi:hypothetical protein
VATAFNMTRVDGNAAPVLSEMTPLMVAADDVAATAIADRNTRIRNVLIQGSAAARTSAAIQTVTR